MNEIIQQLVNYTGWSESTVYVALVIFSVWMLFWKGWALWTAATREEKGWFAALLVLNTMGVLEIVYLFILGKRNK